MESKQDLFVLFYLLFTIGAIGFGGYQYRDLSLHYFALERQFASSTLMIEVFKSDLEKIQKEKGDLSNSLDAEKQRNDEIAGQVAGITDTVGTLQKLNSTDKELLQKYSKIYFLSDNYVPSSLATITPVYLFNEKRSEQIHTNVRPFLQKMLDEASSSNVTLKIASAYRSFGEQSALKSKYLITYGSGANKFSADQGYSEHQLGTAVDFVDSSGVLALGFEKTKASAWLTANAYKYGFIISYPKQNTYYQFEPWHWRFVGVKLATTLHDSNKFFYNLSPREVLTYLVNIFD